MTPPPFHASERPILLATRGSPLALAQANTVMAEFRALLPHRAFALSIIKTTGDKLQSLAIAQDNTALPRGLFTKELEQALLDGQADIAVHSLKDLPTELPPELELGGVTAREDVRDVLICKSSAVPSGGSTLAVIPVGGVVATASVRRAAQLAVLRPDLQIQPIRGNVGTRLRRLAENAAFDGIVLAAAGLHRLGHRLAHGGLEGEGLPTGLHAYYLSLDEMLPCVGQGAIGLEVCRRNSAAVALCRQLNHSATENCVTAERSFLRGMGGGCQSPVAAHGEIQGDQLRLKAIALRGGQAHRVELGGTPAQAAVLGEEAARQLLPKSR